MSQQSLSSRIEHKKTEAEANCAFFTFFVLDVHAHLDNKLVASHILRLLPNAIKMLHVSVNKNVPCDAACCFGGTQPWAGKNYRYQ